MVDTVCLKSKYCEEMIKAYKDSLENNFWDYWFHYEIIEFSFFFL